MNEKAHRNSCTCYFWLSTFIWKLCVVSEGPHLPSPSTFPWTSYLSCTAATEDQKFQTIKSETWPIKVFTYFIWLDWCSFSRLFQLNSFVFRPRIDLLLLLLDATEREQKIFLPISATVSVIINNSFFISVSFRNISLSASFIFITRFCPTHPSAHLERRSFAFPDEGKRHGVVTGQVAK